LFSPIELITEARAAGCSYQETTLRTHIVNYMCVNAAGESAGRYPDLVRVFRGVYRFADDSSDASAPAASGGLVATSETFSSGQGKAKR